MQTQALTLRLERENDERIALELQQRLEEVAQSQENAEDSDSSAEQDSDNMSEFQPAPAAEDEVEQKPSESDKFEINNNSAVQSANLTLKNIFYVIGNE